MSQHWPDPRGHWQEPGPQEWQSGHQGLGGFHPPPGYQSGAWPSVWQSNSLYGYPPQVYPSPGPRSADPAPTTGNLVGAIVVAVVTMLICSGTNIIGLVLACLALGKSEDPGEAAKLARYAWVSNWIHVGIIASAIVFVTGMIVMSS